MVTFEFPPLTDKVKVVFECPECGEQVESDCFVVPGANYDGDNREDFLCTEEYDIICPECDARFSLTVGESVCGGEGWIDELPDDWNVVIEWEQVPEE